MLKPILGGLLLCIASYEAMAQPELQLELSQTLDIDCQGHQQVSTTTVEPGECIRYQLKLTNLGNTPAEKVKINLPIPTSTFLKNHLSVAVGSIALPAGQLLELPTGESVLHTELDQLEAKQQVVLQYSVQVL
ncbi:MAG: hypothetical protein RLZZ215_1358 [Pseudomonadota bacterium]|jgi:uncharacterized repeat protein (TIGR01451 family)